MQSGNFTTQYQPSLSGTRPRGCKSSASVHGRSSKKMMAESCRTSPVCSLEPVSNGGRTFLLQVDLEKQNCCPPVPVYHIDQQQPTDPPNQRKIDIDIAQGSMPKMPKQLRARSANIFTLQEALPPGVWANETNNDGWAPCASTTILKVRGRWKRRASFCSRWLESPSWSHRRLEKAWVDIW